MSLHRCVACRRYTLCEPLLLLLDWRMHLPCCVDCMTSEQVPFELYVRPAHRAVTAALWSFFVAGTWRLRLPTP